MGCTALTTVTFPKTSILFGNEVFLRTAIDPNSMSWPSPVIKTDWVDYDEENVKVRIIQWGEKEFYAIWLKNKKAFAGGDGENIFNNLKLFSNYDDLEAAVFYYVYCDKIRTRGALMTTDEVRHLELLNRMKGR